MNTGRREALSAARPSTADQKMGDRQAANQAVSKTSPCCPPCDRTVPVLRLLRLGGQVIDTENVGLRFHEEIRGAIASGGGGGGGSGGGSSSGGCAIACLCIPCYSCYAAAFARALGRLVCELSKRLARRFRGAAPLHSSEADGFYRVLLLIASGCKEASASAKPTLGAMFASAAARGPLTRLRCDSCIRVQYSREWEALKPRGRGAARPPPPPLPTAMPHTCLQLAFVTLPCFISCYK